MAFGHARCGCRRDALSRRDVLPLRIVRERVRVAVMCASPDLAVTKPTAERGAQTRGISHGISARHARRDEKFTAALQTSLRRGARRFIRNLFTRLSPTRGNNSCVVRFMHGAKNRQTAGKLAVTRRAAFHPKIIHSLAPIVWE